MARICVPKNTVSLFFSLSLFDRFLLPEVFSDAKCILTLEEYRKLFCDTIEYRYVQIDMELMAVSA